MTPRDRTFNPDDRSQVRIADYIAELAKQDRDDPPLVQAIAALRELNPAVEAEIDRINDLPNRNKDVLYPAVAAFVTATFPGGRLPSGEVVYVDPESLKPVINRFFMLLC